MKEYRVYFVQTETFYIDVEADNTKEAVKLAEEEWDTGAYNETGDLKVETTEIEDLETGLVSNVDLERSGDVE